MDIVENAAKTRDALNVAFALIMFASSCSTHNSANSVAPNTPLTTQNRAESSAKAVATRVLRRSDDGRVPPTAGARGMPVLKICSIDEEDAESRDLDLYVTGLNHHFADCESGTREEDLQNIAAVIRQASRDPSRIVIAADGTNPRADGLYVDGNRCPANRLQHILEESYSTSFSGLGSGVFDGCGVKTEYRIIAGGSWQPKTSGILEFGEGGDPDNYMQALLSHRGLESQFSLFVVRFSTGENEGPRRAKQVADILKPALAMASVRRTIIAGDFNFQAAGFEAEEIKRQARWLTWNLKCSEQMLFAPDSDIMNAVMLAPPFQGHDNLKLVGAVYSFEKGIAVPEVCHPLIALRFRVETCPDGAFCGEQCTPFGTSENCSGCGSRCVAPRSCVERQCEGRHCDEACSATCAEVMTGCMEQCQARPVSGCQRLCQRDNVRCMRNCGC
jgi:hypothetical protein